MKEALAEFTEEIALCEADPAMARRKERIAAVRRVTDRLYDLLIRPVRSTLGRPRVIHVSSNGPLQRIPFGELTDYGEPLDLHSRVLGYVDTHPRRASPPRVRRRGKPFLKPLVILGDHQYLKAVPRELETVVELTKARIIVAEQAGKATVLRAIQRSDLIYFIGHAVSRERTPLLSYLDMGATSLFARDIAALRLTSRPDVVLSACEGAREGGGIGIASAFLTAGARSIAASLWRVEDGIAARGASELLEGLIDGVETAPGPGSLHPYLRSPFVRLVPWSER